MVKILVRYIELPDRQRRFVRARTSYCDSPLTFSYSAFLTPSETVKCSEPDYAGPDYTVKELFFISNPITVYEGFLIGQREISLPWHHLFAGNYPFLWRTKIQLRQPASPQILR
jgi:hypothetical protein